MEKLKPFESWASWFLQLLTASSECEGARTDSFICRGWVKDKDALHPAGWGCHLIDTLVWGLEADLVQKTPALMLTTDNKVIPINEVSSFLFSYHSLASLEFCRLNKSPSSIFSCPQSSFWSGREGAFLLRRHGNSGRTVRFLTKPLQ